MKRHTRNLVLSLTFIFLTLSLFSCKNDDFVPPIETGKPDTLSAGWSKILLGTSVDVTDVFFIDHSTGLAIAGSNVYKSANGGTDWNRIFQSTSSLINIAMGSSNNIVLLSADPNLLYSSLDGGITFETVTVSGNQLTEAFFISATEAFAIGNQLLKSVDGGRTWAPVYDFGAQTGFRSVQYPSSSIGWAITPAGLHKTVNGGANWQNITTSGFNFATNSLFFLNGNDGYIADDTKIARTLNAGADFTTVFTGESSFHDLHFLTPELGYLTNGRNIQMTVNGGNSWSPVVRMGEGRVEELHFTDADHGWAACSKGAILRFVN